MLKKSGYSRYEISNYSLPGHQSRHNSLLTGLMVEFWSRLTSSPWGESLQDQELVKIIKNG